jgi:lipooligosaccharide transport system ATP-binding protein
VRGLDLKLQRGECFALLGPNGAGKTTTLRCALGLTEASAGHPPVRPAGPGQAREARARVGVVPQIDSLDPDFTCAENLIVFAGYFGIHEREIRPACPSSSPLPAWRARRRPASSPSRAA